MADRPLDFDIYRLNKDDEDGLLPYMGRPVADDGDILKIIRHATIDPDCDIVTDREKATSVYKWSLREFGDIEVEGTAPVSSVVLARSIVLQKGVIVTDGGIELGTSTPDQGIAVTINVVFFMERHIVAIEYKGSLMGNQVWRTSLHEILDKTARALEYTSSIRLEPVARDAEILETFNSFDLLTRLRLRLLVPNPDMTREMKDLTEEMKDGGVREWLQDMKNRKGLSKAKGKLPHAAASIANRGYKNGPVTMEGQIDGKQAKIITGKNAERVTIAPPEGMADIRNIVTGMAALAKTKEGKTMMETLKREIDRKLEPPKAI